jgi:purine-binding chemotaxis protein CheW
MVTSLVVFSLDELRIAIDLSRVVEIVRATEISRLPQAPEFVLGLINLRGTVIPVLNTRLRFGQPERNLQPDDVFVIARSPHRTVALWADRACGVLQGVSTIVDSELILPGLRYVEGVAKTPDGLILIHDLDRFLSLDEDHLLDQLIKPDLFELAAPQ